jgi:hypothetical protein
MRLSVPPAVVVSPAIAANSTNHPTSPKVRNKGDHADPGAPRGSGGAPRVNCEARADGDEAVVVEVPGSLGEDQARMEVDLYLKAWQASRPDVEAHLL